MQTAISRTLRSVSVAAIAVAGMIGMRHLNTAWSLGTPDGMPPSRETVCNGLSGAAFGLCNAFCEAQDCDVHPRPSCDHLRRNFQKITGSSAFPCEATPTPTVTPAACGVTGGDPDSGTAMCGGQCPLEFPFCEFVPGETGGRCTCVDHKCGTAGTVCNSNLCPNQMETCAQLADGSCTCATPTPTMMPCMFNGPSCAGECPIGESCHTFPSPSDPTILACGCVPAPTPTPIECGVTSGDPASGTAVCGGECPLEFPFCEFVPGTTSGRCTCVDHMCGSPGVACGGNFCPSQLQACTMLSDGSCACL